MLVSKAVQSVESPDKEVSFVKKKRRPAIGQPIGSDDVEWWGGFQDDRQACIKGYIEVPSGQHGAGKDLSSAWEAVDRFVIVFAKDVFDLFSQGDYCDGSSRRTIQDTQSASV